MTDLQSKKLRITLTKSPIGYPSHQKQTVRNLGLRKMHQTVELGNTPTIRGMVDSVSHLVSVEIVDDVGDEGPSDGGPSDGGTI